MTLSRNRLAVAGVLVLLLIAGWFAFLRPSGPTHVTAYFTEAKGIYSGDKVTVLGVDVGKIETITPERGRVRIDMRINHDVKLPTDVKAAIASPALVSVRTIALGPAYDGGPALSDGSVIPISRTAVPVEWDAVKDQLVRLTAALGPNGANKNGSISKLVSSSANYLRGQGTSLNQTIKQLSAAMTTLSDNRGDLFATVRNLQVFVEALEGSDAQVREFNTRLASVSAALSDDREAVAGSLHALRRAFTDVRAFLDENRELTSGTIADLRSTTSVLAENRQRLADLLQVAPTTLSNFYNILDPRNGAQTGVMAFQNLNAPAQIICAALLNLNGKPQQCAQVLEPLVNYLKVDAPPTGLLSEMATPRTGVGSSSGGATGSSNPLANLTSILGGGR
jgi:phospholipid/cholesterol/gamma-HCH transport system substrate-binding protein